MLGSALGGLVGVYEEGGLVSPGMWIWVGLGLPRLVAGWVWDRGLGDGGPVRLGMGSKLCTEIC